jgi:hypothetical protein
MSVQTEETRKKLQLKDFIKEERFGDMERNAYNRMGWL